MESSINNGEVHAVMNRLSPPYKKYHVATSSHKTLFFIEPSSPSRFDIIALVIMALEDEITFLKAEVSEHRTANQRDFRSMEHVVTIEQDVNDIKKFIHKLYNHKEGNSLTFA